MTSMPKQLFQTVVRVLYEGGLSKTALRRLLAEFPDPLAEERALRMEVEYLSNFCPWYTARELAGMPGMPARAADVRQLMDAQGQPWRLRFGCRRQREYPSGAIPLLTSRFMPPGRQVTKDAKAAAVREYEHAVYEDQVDSCRKIGRRRHSYSSWILSRF
jgi:hypothetical protein